MALDQHLKSFIHSIPKAELHVHLEGTIEADLLLSLAERNGIKLPFPDVESARAAYRFKDLRDFLILYNTGTRVLRRPEDFYDITRAYLLKCVEQKILHTEIFIDFQSYLKRQIDPSILMEGILAARQEIEADFGISVELIHCFLRHLGPRAAEEAFPRILEYRDHIIGIGLASNEIGYPPGLFTGIFKMAREQGFRTVAHAGEEGPWEYVRDSIELLQVERIDHGNKSCQNPDLVEEIIRKQIPLTLCPLSNIRLQNVDKIENHTIKRMLDRNMLITINSDDPAYFGGYVNENLELVAETFQLQKKDVAILARNSIIASFASESRKSGLLQLLDNFLDLDNGFPE